MMDTIGTSLYVPRGVPGLPASSYDMTPIYEAEDRLGELRIVNSSTAVELMGYFNEICNLTTKYLAWIDYETLQAQKYYDLAKADVILDKVPEELRKYKESGIKGSEDFRNALITRDPTCSEREQILNELKAVRVLLDNKARSFTRAYYACQTVIEHRSGGVGSPQTSVMLGELSEMSPRNFMGKTDSEKFNQLKKARSDNG